MKILVLPGLLLAALLQIDARALIANSPDLSNYLKDTYDTGIICAKKLGASKLKNLPHIVGLIQFPEDNEALNEFWGCIYKKKGLVNENSEVNEEGLEKYIFRLGAVVGKTSAHDHKVMHKIVEACKNVKGEDYGQTVVKVHNCVIKNGIELKLKKPRN